MTTTGFLGQVDRWLVRVVGLLVVLTTVVMVSCLLIGVVYRYVLQDATSWTDEVALLCFTWVVFLASVLMVQDDGHVRIELIEKILPKSIHFLLSQVIWIAIALVGLYMAWTGQEFITFTFGQTSPALAYPIWLRSGAMPVAGVLIAYFALRKIGRPPKACTRQGRRNSRVAGQAEPDGGHAAQTAGATDALERS